MRLRRPGSPGGDPGRAGIEAEARRRHDAGTPTALVELAGDDRIKSGVIAKALDAKDAVALDLIEEAVVALGTAIASTVTLVDVTAVVLGGGITEKLGAPFVERVDEAVQARLIPGMTVEVVTASLGDDAGVVGAASLSTDVTQGDDVRGLAWRGTTKRPPPEAASNQLAAEPSVRFGDETPGAVGDQDRPPSLLCLTWSPLPLRRFQVRTSADPNGLWIGS